MKLIEVHEYQVVVCFGWIIGRVVEWQGNSPLAESIRCRYLRLRVNAPNIYIIISAKGKLPCYSSLPLSTGHHACILLDEFALLAGS